MKTRLSISVLAAVLFGAVSAPAAQAKPVDGYCSPSGDYCIGINDKGGSIKLKIATFSFTGQYTLCVDPPRGSKACDDFQLEQNGDIYKDSVTLGSHFPSRASGRYAVTWHTQGFKLGKTLHFTRR